jgi:hypothetical protein
MRILSAGSNDRFLKLFRKKNAARREISMLTAAHDIQLPGRSKDDFS